MQLTFLVILLAAARLPEVVYAPSETETKIEPVPFVDKFSYGVRDGLLLRNGKPHFWISAGSDLGNVGASPLGLWLARLQGTTMATLPHSSCAVGARELAPGKVEINTTFNVAHIPWIRESQRLGLLGQCPEGFFKPETSQTLSEILGKYPSLRELIYDCGHHMGADPATEIGLGVLTAKRTPLFSWGDKLGNFMAELNREPGPDPYSRRVREGFRKWAAAKYGTLDEANKVWKQSFASWDDVTLPHTVEENCVPGPHAYDGDRKAREALVEKARNVRSARRQRERSETPELYWDWMIYVQEDTMAGLRREFETTRKLAPNTLVGTDIRGHQSGRDNYVSYDPIATDGLCDIFYAHFSANAYDYGGKPHSDATLADAICWPLFTARWFVRNSTHPVINSEDIPTKTLGAAPSPEAMQRNDLGQLASAKWKIKKHDRGISYRVVFNLNRRLKDDFADGSRRFFLVGFNAKNSMWCNINGHRVKAIRFKGQFFQEDVSAILNYGGENEIKGSVYGVFDENFHPTLHILGGDQLVAQSKYGEKQFTSQYWSYLTAGFSGDLVWDWTGVDYQRYFQAALTKRIEAAAEVALPALRSYRSKTAFLYSYLAGVGLPCNREAKHHELMNWFAALEFTGRRPDPIGEELFRRDAERYSLIVAPDIWCVDDATVKAAENYVRGGGTLVVTSGSLGKTFTRYADSGFAAFAKGDTGKGRVITLEKGLGVAALAEKLEPYLPKQELDVTIAPSAEFPCVERVLAGEKNRKLLYLQNWGGLDQEVTVSLPPEMQGWRLTPLEGKPERTAEGVKARVEGSQGIVACILSAPEAEVPNARLAPNIARAIEKMRELNAFPEKTTKRRVLFPIEDRVRGIDGGSWVHQNYTAYGVMLYPHLVEAVRLLGWEVSAVSPYDWTPELLAQHDAVFILEGNSSGFWIPMRSDKQFKAKFHQMIGDYVKGGGSLFCDIYSGHVSSCVAAFFWELGPGLLRCKPMVKKYARDEVNYGLGDPYEPIGFPVGGHPIVDGVNRVQLSALCPFELFKKCTLAPVITLAKTANFPEAPVALAGEVGKGRVFATCEPMMFQPFRIEHADNAALLLNSIAWTLKTTVTAEQRASFKKNLFLKESDLRR